MTEEQIDDSKSGKKQGNSVAVIETNKGTIKFELYENKAPNTAKNFINLANDKFYDGLTFHRVVPDFVVQGGDPDGDGTGGSSTHIKLEIHPEARHVKGAVAMARSQDPDSASSQFYFALKDLPQLDDNYAVFGIVTEGFDVVENLEIADIMKTVRIE